ncbi:MAG: hypothetical protein ABL986_23285 [Vicinamibacterales bacterium]
MPRALAGCACITPLRARAIHGMNLLLALNAPHYLRPFIGAVRQLASRGHRITVAWYDDADKRGELVIRRFADCPTVRFVTMSSVRSERRVEVGLLRRARNYARYLDKPFRASAKLRQRSFTKLVRLAMEERPKEPPGSDVALALSPSDVHRLQETLIWVESLVPPDPAATALIREGGFDAVLVSPLVDLGSSSQVDLVKAAQALGVPVGLLVYSWDNLTTKGDVHVTPDKVFVWNDRQATEAIKLHDVPPERVVIAGAPRFDEFLACESTVLRKRFLTQLGFDRKAPVVMYVCSSAFVSGDELPFIRQWLAELRRADLAAVRDCSVIVRPHPDVPLLGPEHAGTKLDFGFDGSPATVRRPFDDPRAVVLSTSGITTQGLWECLHHSDAVVGLNTSAEIEAGLLGCPVLSVLAGDAADGQQTTLHFHYLLKQHGGFVDVADSLPQHIEQLGTVLGADKTTRGNIRRAVLKRAMSFVRPLGAARPVSELLADAIEREMAPPAISGGAAGPA